MVTHTQLRRIRLLPALTALAFLTGCPLWNRFVDDIGLAGLQVDYRPPLREAARTPAIDEPPPDQVEPTQVEAALTDEEAAEEHTGERLGRALGPGGERLTILSSRTLDTGLTVEVLRLGEGKACAADSWVMLRSRGSLASGEVFDDSGRHEVSGPWKVSQLITGMQQGIVGMREGGIRELTIPPELAYGDQAVYGDAENQEPIIPPGSTIVYAVELIEVFADPAEARQATPVDDEAEDDLDSAAQDPDKDG